MRVNVAATTANIGPGFDCLGISLDLYNSYQLVETKSKDDEPNLATKAYRYFYEQIEEPAPDKEVDIIEANIPQARGLGSSASLIVAGLVLANEENNSRYTDEQLFALATDLEGHPDNVAPAIFGGFNVVSHDALLQQVNFDVDDLLYFYAFNPDYSLSTEDCRAVLPQEVLHQDAVKNLTHTALLVAKLAKGQWTDLKDLFEDFLHEPYRKELIRDYDQIKALNYRDDVIGVYLSGAGPTMIALSYNEDLQKEITFPFEGSILKLKATNEKYSIVE